MTYSGDGPTVTTMNIVFDSAKRDVILKERRLDFAKVAVVFAGPFLELEDDRFDYGETQLITFGYLDGREVVVVWPPRGDSRHIISLRKANEREQNNFYKQMG